MGAVNYFTSDYITMGVPLLYSCDLKNDPDFMEEVRAEAKSVPTWKQYERETA